MEKPISLRREDCIASIVTAINNSGLPAFALADILDGLRRQVAQLAQQQLEDDAKAYEESLKEEEKKEEN